MFDGDRRYKRIAEHYEDCFRKYGDNHKGVDWPNEPDALKRYGVMLDVMDYDRSHEKTSGIKILDFGCGLGHLYQYVLDQKYDVRYSGMDISPEFLEVCRSKYPDIDFIQRDVLADNVEDLEGKYDYIVVNGVFTEKCDLEYEEMKSFFQNVIKKLFGMCNRGIAFNVMSKDVDWERDDLFHLPLNELSSFVVKELSRCFLIRNDYGLYEYTTYVYKL